MAGRSARRETQEAPRAQIWDEVQQGLTPSSDRRHGPTLVSTRLPWRRHLPWRRPSLTPVSRAWSQGVLSAAHRSHGSLPSSFHTSPPQCSPPGSQSSQPARLPRRSINDRMNGWMDGWMNGSCGTSQHSQLTYQQYQAIIIDPIQGLLETTPGTAFERFGDPIPASLSPTRGRALGHST